MVQGSGTGRWSMTGVVNSTYVIGGRSYQGNSDADKDAFKKDLQKVCDLLGITNEDLRKNLPVVTGCTYRLVLSANVDIPKPGDIDS